MSINLVKGTSVTLGSRIINLGLGIIVSVMLARLLGPEDRGIYALIVLLPSFAMMFSNFGIPSATIYLLGKKRFSPNEIAGNNIVMSLVLAFLAIVFSVLFLIFSKDNFFKDVPVVALFIVIFSIPFLKLNENFSNILLGIHKYIKFNIVNLVSVIAQLIIYILLYTFSQFNIYSITLTYLLSSIIVFLISYIYLKKEIKFITFKLNFEYIKSALNYGIKSFLGNIISFLHLRIDIFIINYFLNPISVGFYAIAVGLTERLWLLSQSASTMLFPKISSEESEKVKKTITPILCRNILILTLIGGIILFLIGEWLIILLFSNEYINAVLPFQILLIGIVLGSGSRILANDISGRGKPIINTYINIASLLINVVLNIIFIPKYGINGAAYATSISYSLVFIIRTIVYAKISNNKLTDIIFIKLSDLTIYKEVFKSIFKKIKLNVQSR